MKRVFYTIITILLLSPGKLLAQDPHFSQYYAAPLYLNPAFAGSSAEHRFVVNYRNQWPSIPKAFSTFAFSYDYNLSSLKSGIGILATTDRAGSADLKSSSLGLVYSYKIQYENWVLTPAVQFSYGVRNIDFDKLVFGDQIVINGPTQDDALNQFSSVSYFDFHTGILLYNQKMWLGYAVHHLNEPNKSLLDDVDKIPIRQSIHAGINVPLYNGPFKKRRVSSLSPSMVYHKQGSFDQLDLGLNYIYDPVYFGIWYRGIPLQQDRPKTINHDSFIFLTGLNFGGFEIGYSYDFTVSEMGPASGGAHEVSLKLEIISSLNLKRPKPAKFIPCPAFYNKSHLLR